VEDRISEIYKENNKKEERSAPVLQGVKDALKK
jgi:hypothetical protein